MTFWDHHGVLFLICAVFFPRLTILFATGLPAILGVLGWIGWLVLPRFVIAYFGHLRGRESVPRRGGLDRGCARAGRRWR